MPDKSRNPFVVEVEHVEPHVPVQAKVVTKPEPTPPPQPPAVPVSAQHPPRQPLQQPSQPHLVPPAVKKIAHKAQPQWGMFFAGMGTAFLLSGATYGGWMLYSKQSVPATPQPTPTPLVGVLLPPDTATPTPTPALTASSWSKGLIKVDVLNGTGVVGKAGTILTKIVTLGYKKGTTGNAADQTGSTLALTSDVATLSAEIVKEFEPLVGKITVSEKPLKGIGLVQVTVGK